MLYSRLDHVTSTCAQKTLADRETAMMRRTDEDFRRQLTPPPRASPTQLVGRTQELTPKTMGGDRHEDRRDDRGAVADDVNNTQGHRRVAGG